MLALPELALAIFVLLVTPGPTNTLLAMAGAEQGWGRALRLIPFEVAGYLTTILPLVLVGGAMLARHAALQMAIALLAAIWVLWLAVRLWHAPPARRPAVTVTAGRIYVTTMLNPKALIFGLVLLPAETTAGLALSLGLFVAQVLGVASVWAWLGQVLTRRAADATLTPGLPAWLRRAAALWLGAIALWLASGVVRALV